MSANTIAKYLTEAEERMPSPVVPSTHEQQTLDYARRHKDWAFQQVYPILSIPEDFDGYGSTKPSQEIIFLAASYLVFLKVQYKVTPPVISPTRTGGVIFEWQSSTKSLEIEIDSLMGGYYLYKDPSNNVRRSGSIQVNARVEDGLNLALKLMFSGEFA